MVVGSTRMIPPHIAGKLRSLVGRKCTLQRIGNDKSLFIGFGDVSDMTTTPIRFSHDIHYELGNAMAWYDYDDQVKVSRFRSEHLESMAHKVFPESCHTTFSESVELTFQEFLADRRALVEGKLPADDLVTAELCRPNSLLVVDWASSLFDGAVTPETDGFIDDDCMPGWDSWLTLAEVPSSHGKRCLICWVPLELSARVNFGIEVDAASCMSWLNVSEGKFSLIGWGSSNS